MIKLSRGGMFIAVVVVNIMATINTVVIVVAAYLMLERKSSDAKGKMLMVRKRMNDMPRRRKLPHVRRSLCLYRGQIGGDAVLMSMERKKG
jgi:hypothetical protein